MDMRELTFVAVVKNLWVIGCIRTVGAWIMQRMLSTG